jgi:hypothetical protein
MASNIPRFTSFRPKPKVPTEAAHEPRRPLVEEPDSSISSKEKERERKRESRSRHEDTKARNDDRKTSQIHDAKPSKLFFSDRRGDADIIKYGSLNKYDIPAYRSHGYGFVLGLALDWKIDGDRSTPKEIVITPTRRRREERLLASKHIGLAEGRNIRFLKTVKESHDVGADFISISATGKKKREDEEEDHEDDYRGFEDERSNTKPLDPDAEYESETLVSSEDTEAALRNSELVRQTHEHPQDVQNWFDLAHHQEAMMRVGRVSSELSVSDKQHLADIRVSTYEQALKKVGNDPESVSKLYVVLMSEAQRSWDKGKLTSKWTEILAKFPQNEDLWIQYLNFVQSSFIGFKYESCRTVFLECLHAIQTGASQARPEFLLHVVVRLTCMIQQAGYQELAIAAWQALLEFHLLDPKPHHSVEKVRTFEEFWESEEPRIGEIGAKGWGLTEPDETSSQPLEIDRAEAHDPSKSGFQDFCKRELDSTIKLRYPGRTMDEIGEDDAFHTVLHSDIADILLTVPQGTEKRLLLSAFLRFCHLPSLLNTGAGEEYGLDDPFLQLNSRKPQDQDEPSHFSQSLAKYANCPLGEFQSTTDMLIDQSFPEALTTIDIAFVRRVLKLLVFNSPCDDCIGEYLLAFEFKYFPIEVSKTAKKLLKGYSSSLRLYNAYGLVESRCGNSAKADQVFSMALSMVQDRKGQIVPYRLDLFNNWVWEALRHSDSKQALWRLVSLNGQVSTLVQNRPDQSDLLRSQSALNDSRERALLGNDHCDAVKATSLLALLGYLAGEQDIENALSVHRTLLNWFAQRSLAQSPAAELHAQSIAQLLTYHTSHASIVKPSLLRTTLEPLVRSFPNNTILLPLYAANEARFSIDDRVRTIMHQNTLSLTTKRNIVGWMFAIHYEKLRGEIAGSTSHSIRALFKKAEDAVGTHCPALWKDHVLFELEEARKERAKRPNKKPRRDGKKRKEESIVEDAYRRVTETFFKGMTQLPWCKDYIMLAFTHLGEEFLTEEELRKVFNVMVEKELRLYVELDTADM